MTMQILRIVFGVPYLNLLTKFPRSSKTIPLALRIFKQISTSNLSAKAKPESANFMKNPIRPFSTSSPENPEGEMKHKLSFEQFKLRHVESFEEFHENPEVKQLYGDSAKKAYDAYLDYCQTRYNAYLQSLYDGNPATMV